MIIKKTPKDFIVEEIFDFIIKKDGEFKLFILEKTGLETISLINTIAKKNNLPLSVFKIAGIKDKQAKTKQYFTIPNKYDIKSKRGDNFEIKFVGFVEEEIRVGSLIGNKFEIVVSDLSKENVEDLDNRIKFFEKFGVINYFDEQRFGSIVEGEFIGKNIVKGDYENAVKLFLYSQYIRASYKFKFSKEEFFKKVDFKKKGDFPYYNSLFSVFQETESFKLTYKRIPIKQREIFLIAYQSYLWNLSVSNLLALKVGISKLKKVKYVAGDFNFFKDYVESNLDIDSFQTIGRKFVPSNIEKEIVDKILNSEGLNLEDFHKVSKSGNFLKSEKRKLFFYPKNCMVLNSQKEINGKYKIRISFELSKGSYATIFLKNLF